MIAAVLELGFMFIQSLGLFLNVYMIEIPK